VFNRLLRHNLRNRLDVIKSHTERLAEQTDGQAAETVLSEADRLAAIGTRARRIDQLMSRDSNPSSVDLTTLIRDILRDIDSEGLTITTDFPHTATLQTDAEILRTALISPLENAAEYAASTVTVSLRSTADGWTVIVSDDGDGIPASELEALADETETALKHGRGLGLWQLKWGIEALDGDLSFDTEDGTTITITLEDLTAHTDGSE
jgi:signal transduction histidine kinase